jgi:D-alanine-D-alanine ligase-like ATP-grasp enzyme
MLGRVAAQDIGLPVVVKPIDADHGRGVSLDLKTEAEIHTAFDIALREEEKQRSHCGAIHCGRRAPFVGGR